MPYEDQDFIMRQIKGYAKGLGVLLDIESLKELLKLEFSVDEELSDREIESIIYTARVENYINTRLLSQVELEKMLDLPPERVEHLMTTTEDASQQDLDMLKKLIEDEQNWLNTERGDE
ncbi:hypothetical protein SAMN04488102_10728 [Alkalibacterium subtropicum]|uniref:Uncharacterized protein n=1 Tax=Alkalibacterium subtropicum TaxID=753702 RepID=A0A1I1JE32_9LACT|nr:hypothetical protein [Alkalibacterium subtropicum]SFC44878.1 hypothetical protein SAMN04488102_10728 [Alkalibacterium subtropicum]